MYWHVRADIVHVRGRGARPLSLNLWTEKGNESSQEQSEKTQCSSIDKEELLPKDWCWATGSLIPHRVHSRQGNDTRKGRRRRKICYIFFLRSLGSPFSFWVGGMTYQPGADRSWHCQPGKSWQEVPEPRFHTGVTATASLNLTSWPPDKVHLCSLVYIRPFTCNCSMQSEMRAAAGARVGYINL